MFDDFLRRRAAQTGEAFVPFDIHADYDRFVDGKKRADGVRSFLAARGISLPDGRPTTARGGHRLRPRQPQERARAGQAGRWGGGVPGIGALRRGGPGRRPRTGGGVVERQHRGRPQGDRLADLFNVWSTGSWPSGRGWPASRPRQLPVRRPGTRRHPCRGGGVRGRPGRGGGGRAGGFGFVVGVDRTRGFTSRPGRRPRNCSATAPNRRDRPRRTARRMIESGFFRTEPWLVREATLDLGVLAQSESIFALANGHLGLRGNLDEGEPTGCPAPTSTACTSSVPFPTPRPGSAIRSPARPASTSPTGR